MFLSRFSGKLKMSRDRNAGRIKRSDKGILMVLSVGLLLGTVTAPAARAAAPTFSSISPATGSVTGGTPVTISGAGFVSGATVTIGGSSATGVSFVSATSITAITPAGIIGAQDIVITNTDLGTVTGPGAFAYTGAIVPPTFTSISPATGSPTGGTPVTISGTGFDLRALVTIAGLPLLPLSVTATTFTGLTPGGPVGAQDIVITNPDSGTVTVVGAFTYNAPPVIVATPPPAPVQKDTIESASDGEKFILVSGNFPQGVIDVKVNGQDEAFHADSSTIYIVLKSKLNIGQNTIDFYDGAQPVLEYSYVYSEKTLPKILISSMLTPRLTPGTNTYDSSGHLVPTSGSIYILTAKVTGEVSYAPAGVGAWFLDGNPVNCTSQNRTFDKSQSATLYSCQLPPSSSAKSLPTFSYGGDENYLAVPSVAGDPLLVSYPDISISVKPEPTNPIVGAPLMLNATISSKVGINGGDCAWSDGQFCNFSGSTQTSSSSEIVFPSTSGPLSRTFAFYTGVPCAASECKTEFTEVIDVQKYQPALQITHKLAKIQTSPAITFIADVEGVEGVAPKGDLRWLISSANGLNAAVTAGSLDCQSKSGPVRGLTVNSYLYYCTILSPAADYTASASLTNDDAYGDSSTPTEKVNIPAIPTVSSALKLKLLTAIKIGSRRDIVGSTVSFRAQVKYNKKAGVPTGDAIFTISNGSTPVGNCTFQSTPTTKPRQEETFLCHYVVKKAGVYSATFTIQGDDAYNSSEPVTSQSTTVALASATLTLTTMDQPTLGGTVNILATITGKPEVGAPTGALTVFVNGGDSLSLCTTTDKTIINDYSTSFICPIELRYVGDYIVNANLDPDSQYSSTSSSYLTLHVVSVPKITSISPPFGDDATPLKIRITGTGFAAGVVVTLDERECGTSELLSANLISSECSTSHSGLATVVVTNLDGGTTTNSTLLFVRSTPSVTLKVDGTPALGAAVKVIATVIGFPDLGVPAGALTFSIQEGAGVSGPCDSTGSAPLNSYSISYYCIFKLADLGDYVVTASLAGELKYNLVPNTTITLHAPTAPSISGVNTPVIPLQVATTISITGKGFTRDSLVTLNGDACLNVFYISDTALKVDCLPTVSGSATITVSSGGLVATNSDLIFVLGRVLVTLATTGAPTLGSTVQLVATVTGTGSLGVPDGALTFTDLDNSGENVCEAQTKSPINSNSIAYSCDLKLSHSGNYLIQAIVARDSHYDSASSMNLALQVISAPVITRIAPAVMFYGTSVNLDIFGRGYELGSIVYLNGKPCASSNWISSDHLQGACFAENVGPATIIVTNPDGGTTSNSKLFSVLPIPLISIDAPNSISSGTIYSAGAISPANATFDGQWQKSDDGLNWVDIQGATSRTYSPIAGDATNFLRVAARGTGFYTGSVYSDKIAVVAILATSTLEIFSVSPIFLKIGTAIDVTINGIGFNEHSSVMLETDYFGIGNDPGSGGGIKILSVTFISPSVLKVKILVQTLNVGVKFVVTNLDSSSVDSQLTITVS